MLQELFVTLTGKAMQRCSNEEALAVWEDLRAWPLMVVDYPAVRAAVGLADQAKISFRDALIVGGGGAGRRGGAVHRRFERRAGDSRGSNQQSVRGVMDPWGLRSWVRRKRCRRGAEENKWPPMNADEDHNHSFTVLSGSPRTPAGCWWPSGCQVKARCAP